MRRWLVAVAALGTLVASPLYAASFSVSASSGVGTTAHVSSTGFGTASVTSFGAAGSAVTVTPGFASTTSSQVNSVKGQSFGSATYSGTANTSTSASGFGAWSAPH